jgi:uncharacterized protein with HEPN domain
MESGTGAKRLRMVLRDLSDLIRRIEELVQRVGNLDAYLADPFFPAAAEGYLMRLREITNRLPDEFKAKYPKVHWREIRGMGNLVVHRYDDVDHEIVWVVLTTHIPEMRDHLGDALPAPREWMPSGKSRTTQPMAVRRADSPPP